MARGRLKWPTADTHATTEDGEGWHTRRLIAEERAEFGVVVLKAGPTRGIRTTGVRGEGVRAWEAKGNQGGGRGNANGRRTRHTVCVRYVRMFKVQRATLSTSSRLTLHHGGPTYTAQLRMDAYAAGWN